MSNKVTAKILVVIAVTYPYCPWHWSVFKRTQPKLTGSTLESLN